MFFLTFIQQCDQKAKANDCRIIQEFYLRLNLSRILIVKVTDFSYDSQKNSKILDEFCFFLKEGVSGAKVCTK